MTTRDYDDSYSTCAETFATLRLFGATVTPGEISHQLGMAPSRQQTKGEQIAKHCPERRKEHGWFLSSEGVIVSRDVRRHIDWILDSVWEVRSELRVLLAGPCHGDIFCYWVSAAGHGGPTLSQYQMTRMSEIGLECSFDVYFHETDGE